MRSGFAALIGRPNVGKSTLLNRLVGTKVAIVSPKPQTTRGRTLGIVTNTDGQVVFVDTPGIHQAAGALNGLMVEVALSAASDCDVVLFMIDAEGQHEDKEPKVSPGNRLVIEKLKQFGKPTFLLVNKIDTIKKVLMLPLIDCYRTEFPFAQVFPVSARRGEGLDELVAALISEMPEGEYLFPADSFTDQSERTLVAEYVREKVLRHCHQEIPYSTAVVVEVFDESERDTPPPQRKNVKKKPTAKKKTAGIEAEVAPVVSKPELAGLIRIHANIFVERDSQKAIIIGKNGQMLKTIGTDARLAIQRLLGTHIFLSLQVKVEPRWTETMGGLAKLGYRLGG